MCSVDKIMQCVHVHNLHIAFVLLCFLALNFKNTLSLESA